MQSLASTVMEQRVRSLQVIVGAMLLGAGTFMFVALLIEPPKPPSGTPVITYVGLAYGIVAVIARFVLPGLIARGQWNRLLRSDGESAPPAGVPSGAVAVDDASSHANLFATIGIIRAAVIEGAALLLILAYLLERTTLSLALAAVLLVVLAASIPTRGGARTWLEVQQRRLEGARAARQ